VRCGCCTRSQPQGGVDGLEVRFRRSEPAVLGFADDDPNAKLPDTKHLGAIDETLASDAFAGIPVHLAMGPGAARDRLIMKTSDRTLASVIHPTATVSEYATVSQGVFIGPGAIINARATVRTHAIVNTASVVEHDCAVGIGAHVAPTAAMGGGASLGDHSLLGMGAVVLPNISIGDKAIVGAAALVNKDVPNGLTVAGIPAKAIANSA